jgi:hypothetical protein
MQRVAVTGSPARCAGIALAACQISLPQLPVLAGADGTVYATNVTAASNAVVVALSPDLHEKWRVQLEAPLLASSRASLAPDGVMYLPLSAAENDIVAVQTTSPGVADSSWPTLRANVGATNWAGGQF